MQNYLKIKPCRIFPFVFICSLFVSSCKKFVEIPPPETQVLGVDVFTNDQTAASAISGLYTQIMRSNNTAFNGTVTIYPGLSADEIQRTTNTETYTAFSNNAIPTDNSTASDFWNSPYRFIYIANAILEGVQASSKMTASMKSQISGEAKFIRAFCYFYLTNLFGDVPLVTATNYQVNSIEPRRSSDEIYDQIIADLLDAQSSLTVNYSTTQSYPTDRTRPNKLAATALLARVYLFKKNWTNAEAQASTVINSNVYSLVTSLPSVFLATSNEAILQFQPVNTINTYEGNQFVATSNSAKPNYMLTPSLLAAFEPGDLRKTNWTKTNNSGGQPFTYPYKYRTRTGGAPFVEYNVVLRLAEQYLIRAEARAQLGNLTGAKQDLNFIRQRANLGNITAGSQNALLLAIEQENRIEFFAEWGHRWFDLKRTDRADAILAPLKGSNWQSTDVLYPITRDQLLKNPFLTQNSGY
jgi:starch-binding outer membrane protein, SusD/RagB family